MELSLEGSFAQKVLTFDVASRGTPASLQVDLSGRAYVTWWKDSSYFGVFDQQGQSLGRPIPIAGYLSQWPNLALDADQSVIVWRDVSFDMNSYIRVRRYDHQDSTLSPSVVFNWMGLAPSGRGSPAPRVTTIELETLTPYEAPPLLPRTAVSGAAG
jgi:hypothetical protein